MGLNTQKFALAATITLGVAYVVCAVFTLLWPEAALTLLGWVAHVVNVEKFAGGVTITLGGFVAGLIQILIYTYVVTWIFAWLYNRSVQSKG